MFRKLRKLEGYIPKLAKERNHFIAYSKFWEQRWKFRRATREDRHMEESRIPEHSALEMTPAIEQSVAETPVGKESRTWKNYLS